ncbi:MAG: hypothetical protein GF383_05200 [Candidatus Lokiarchaeota archaeon]|nr:hypothetical protein [Candidatus Lokiarchaeota archaeon]MBD3339289.1 hypothetical protein [Candidatus Lokiarchaeota archaeon]
MSIDLTKEIVFFNIGKFQSNDSFFTWTSNSNHKTNLFDIRMTRNPPAENIFYCITKADLKIVYFRKKDLVYSIAAKPAVQSQLMEAIMEHFIKEFDLMYDDSLLVSCYGDDFGCNIFDGFANIIYETLQNYEDLDIIKKTLVYCKTCNKTLTIIIKKSVVESSTKPTAPIVYIHSGHALLVYVDKQYKVRGNELVAVSY